MAYIVSNMPKCFRTKTMDKWECKECDNLELCVLLMPEDHELTATVCPYSGTDCEWIEVKDEKPKAT